MHDKLLWQLKMNQCYYLYSDKNYDYTFHNYKKTIHASKITTSYKGYYRIIFHPKYTDDLTYIINNDNYLYGTYSRQTIYVDYYRIPGNHEIKCYCTTNQSDTIFKHSNVSLGDVKYFIFNLVYHLPTITHLLYDLPFSKLCGSDIKLIILLFIK